jgi:hypothetical protein
VDGIEAGIFDFLDECKTTQGLSLRLEARWLNKITTEAAAGNKLPMLSIRFRPDILASLASTKQQQTGKTEQVAEADWVAVPQSVMERMLWHLRFGGDDE